MAAIVNVGTVGSDGGAPMSGIRVGCAVIALHDGELVLGRRGKEPYYGKWIIPGGGVHRFEKLVDTATREFTEETGLNITIHKLRHIAEIIQPPEEHRLVIYVEASVESGTAKAGSDLLEVGFFSKEDVARLDRTDQLTPTVRDVLRRFGWLEEDTASQLALGSYAQGAKANPLCLLEL